MTPETAQALTSAAFSEGRRAGLLRLAPILNPYRDDDPLHQQWRNGWGEGLTAGYARYNTRAA